ncbi:MAG: large subunit ribosomal protein [Actinomycetota bacterium]|jgi:large subunit ribosomal protein L25
MADTRLALAVRTDIGSSRANRLRKTGRIPGVVYGTGHTPISVTVDARELRTALSGGHGLNAVLDLDVDGETHSALARELQRHPVKGTVQHVDFQIVRLDQPISADVPVEITGEAHEVAMQGGSVQLEVGSLTITAVPRSIPALIEIDVTNLKIGEAIRLSDITLPAGVTCDLDPETMLVAALAPRTDEEPETTEGGAAAEAEGGEGAGGDAAAEGDAPAEASEGE